MALNAGSVLAALNFVAGIIDRTQFSVLVSVVVASAILPTVLVQRYFHPKHAFEAMGSEAEPELLDGGPGPAGGHP